MISSLPCGENRNYVSIALLLCANRHKAMCALCHTTPGKTLLQCFPGPAQKVSRCMTSPIVASWWQILLLIYAHLWFLLFNICSDSVTVCMLLCGCASSSFNNLLFQHVWHWTPEGCWAKPLRGQTFLANSFFASCLQQKYEYLMLVAEMLHNPQTTAFDHPRSSGFPVLLTVWRCWER